MQPPTLQPLPIPLRANSVFWIVIVPEPPPRMPSWLSWMKQPSTVSAAPKTRRPAPFAPLPSLMFAPVSSMFSMVMFAPLMT